MLLMESGRWRVKEIEPTCTIISKGPRYFSVSFLEGWVVQMLSDLTKTLSPILKSSGGVRCLSVETKYLFCASDMWDRSCWCRSSRSTAKSQALVEAMLCLGWTVMLGW